MFVFLHLHVVFIVVLVVVVVACLFFVFVGTDPSWLGVGMIFLILSLLPKILEPAKVLIQVVVTFFFSTLFVMLAHSDIEERS